MLPRLNKIVVTSRTTRRDVVALGVEPGSIAVVEPATARGALRVRSGASHARLLCVGTLTPRKAHDVLFRALAYQRRARWRLLCVGSISRNTSHARRLRALVAQLHLGKRVRFTGEVSADVLSRLYGRTDLFTLPSLHEGYGMAFAEAIARGVPVVGARAGAVPEVVPRQASVLVQPGQVKALARALRPLLRSRWRERLARGAYLRRRRFPDWPAQVRAFVQALPAGGSMTGFSPEWLALRVTFDRRARDAALAQEFVAALPPSPLIVDLGAGTGANAAALAPLIGPQARFRLVDNDRALLDIARARSKQFETVAGDLARDLDGLIAGADAVTASALMDLASE